MLLLVEGMKGKGRKKRKEKGTAQTLVAFGRHLVEAGDRPKEEGGEHVPGISCCSKRVQRDLRKNPNCLSNSCFSRSMAIGGGGEKRGIPFDVVFSIGNVERKRGGKKRGEAPICIISI